MKKTLIFAALVFSMTISGALAAEEVSQTVVKNGATSSGTGSHKTFTGAVWHDSLFKSAPYAPYSVSYVTFEPGARTLWHTHPAGQRLIVVSGTGLTGTADGKIWEIKAGDAIDCPPDVKHWHGASPTTAMTHMAITPFKDGKNVTWMEEVTNDQYKPANQ